LAFQDYSLVSFLLNSSFLNQHLLIDHSTKLSHLDVVLVIANSKNYSVAVLYNSFLFDTYLVFFLKYFSIMPNFISSYQDTFSLALIFSPEIILAFEEYFKSCYNSAFIGGSVSACFDSYTSNLIYSALDSLFSLLTFFLFA
jgi:hypothetical protein